MRISEPSPIATRFGAETNRDGLKERFDTLLRSKFGLVSGIQWKSAVKGLDTVSLIPGPVAKGKTAPELLYVIANFIVKGRRTSETFTLTSNGELMNPVPRALKEQGVTREAIFSEVLDTLEKMDIGFWRKVGVDILPPGEGGILGDVIEEEVRGGGGPSVVDPRRLELVRSQRGALFGFTNPARGGFASYHAVVFPDFVLLEHPKTHNAAFFLDIPSIGTDQPPSAEETEAWIRRQPWAPLLSKPRGEIRKQGVTVVEHKGKWEDRLVAEISKRTKKKAP